MFWPMFETGIFRTCLSARANFLDNTGSTAVQVEYGNELSGSIWGLDSLYLFERIPNRRLFNEAG
jgi:hypothetical protein